MRRKTRFLLSLLIGTALVFATGCGNQVDNSGPPTAQTLEEATTPEISTILGITKSNYPRIDGSTSTLPLVQELYKTMFASQDNTWAEMPQSASKTVPSYELLIAGQVDMVFVPYASQTILESAKNKGVELQFFPISLEALIFITNKDNPAQNITEEQVKKIYIDYAIRNWKELGGPDKELIPICRNADSGSQSQLDNFILKGEAMHPKINDNFVELTMDGLLELVAFYQNASKKDCFALGYTLYYYMQNIGEIISTPESLKILNYEGIAATAETIQDGSYPLSSKYYAVIRKELPHDHSARTIINWLLSKDANKCIRQSGLTPLNKNK